MLVVTPQMAVALAALSASVASAVVLPSRNQYEAQRHMSLPQAQAQAAHRHAARGGAPIPPLPPSMMNKINSVASTASDATPKGVVDHHRKHGKSTEEEKKKKKKKGSKTSKHGDEKRSPDHEDDHHHHHHHHHHDHDHHKREVDENGVTLDVAVPPKLRMLGVEVGKQANIQQRSPDHDHHHHHHHHDDHDHDHHHRRALRANGPRRLASEGTKRDTVNIYAGGRHRPLWYYRQGHHDKHGDVLRLKIGRSAKSSLEEKRSLYTGKQGPVGNSLKALLSATTRSAPQEPRDHHQHHHHHHHGHRRDIPGVEGIVTIVSTVAGSSTPETIASLLLSDDSTSLQKSFVLNASNNTATHVYLVPTNATDSLGAQSASSTDGSIPVALHVEVYSPGQAEMVPYCVQYDPNPPAPAPLTAQPCSQAMTDHSSQVFSYDPATGVIVPMWTVSPSSTDPSASSESESEGFPNNSSSSSMWSSTTTPTATSSVSDANVMASSTMSMAMAKRTDAASQDTNSCDTDLQAADTQSANSNGTSYDGMTPHDVSLVFTPVDAAAILSSKIVPAATTFFPADAGSSNSTNADNSTSPNIKPVISKNATSSDINDADGQDPAMAEPSMTSAGQDDGDNDDTGLPNGSEDAAQVLSTDEPDPASSTASTTSSASPSMTPVTDAATPYSWMFTPDSK